MADLIEAPKSSKHKIKPEMTKDNSSLQSNQTKRLKINLQTIKGQNQSRKEKGKFLSAIESN